MSGHSAESGAAFRVDEDGTLRFKNGAACGSVLREVDGYYVWYPSAGGGFWESAYLRKIADLLDQMNAEWDAIVRSDPETARGDRKAKLLAINRQLSLLAENLALKAKVATLEDHFAELDQQNMHLLDVITEHRLATDPTTRVPLLRVVDPIADDDWFARLYDERGNVQ